MTREMLIHSLTDWLWIGDKGPVERSESSGMIATTVIDWMQQELIHELSDWLYYNVGKDNDKNAVAANFDDCIATAVDVVKWIEANVHDVCGWIADETMNHYYQRLKRS